MSDKKQKELVDILKREDQPTKLERINVREQLPAHLPGPPPTAGMIRSVKLLGVRSPIQVAKHGNGYTVVDGRRRVMAARAAGLNFVPAIVVGGGRQGAVSTIALNENRSENPLAELDAIQALQKQGHSEEEISKATGMLLPRVRLRLSLVNNLHPQILHHAKHGTIKLSVAKAAAKLPKNQQDRLFERIEANIAARKESGRELAGARLLTADDLHQVKTTAAKRSAEALGIVMPTIPAAQVREQLLQAVETWGQQLEAAEALPSVLKACWKFKAALESWDEEAEAGSDPE